VTSAINSKIILDESGAECLIGHGDMLIEGSVPINRLQGSMVSKRDNLHKKWCETNCKNTRCVAHQSCTSSSEI
jgi:hypothetical protein